MIKDPELGDSVIISGTIKAVDGGVALVEVYRSYPVGGTVAVQCGALGHIEYHQTAEQAASITPG